MTADIAFAIWMVATIVGLLSAVYLAAMLIPAYVLAGRKEKRVDRDRHYLSGGHVYCPLRREDTDIESCLGCGSLKNVDVRSSPPFIVCDPPRASASLESDALYMSWQLQHHRRPR
ncbi:MAG TPA: hypothetical protein VGQ86_08230 [Candidatus Limnocylindria bacterium]|jgi:hypothetical protein|nr:hypothetical protein [Candidatus Limnocylindria bacterium]